MIDSVLRSRRQCVILVSCFVSLVASFIIITYVVSGHDFIHEVLLTGSRRYSIETLIRKTLQFASNTQIPLIAVLPVIFDGFTGKRVRVVSLYFVVAIGTGIYFSGGVGVDINGFFDSFISLSIATGMLFSFLREKIHTSYQYSDVIYSVLPIILAFGIFVKVPQKVFQYKDYSAFAVEEKKFLEDAAFIGSVSGPAICENILLCQFGGKRFEYDPFNVGEMIVAGRVDEEKVLSLLVSGYFTAIQLNSELETKYLREWRYGPVTVSGRFTENFKRAVGKYYVWVE